METQARSTMEKAKEKIMSCKLIRENEIRDQQQKMDSFLVPFQRSLDSIEERFLAARQSQAKLAEIKAELREVEDEFVKVLAVKTRKEARKMCIRDSISATKARIEELRIALQLQRSKRDEYAGIISRQFLAKADLEDKMMQYTKRKEDIQEAISWYNRVLGFRVEAGHGVKFTFTNICTKNPEREYSFTVHYANDNYTLLDCDPHVNGIKGLLQELNSSNDLFRFVRIMREKFREAALGELPIQLETHQQDSCTVSTSAPAVSVSSDSSTPPLTNSEHQASQGFNQHPSQIRRGRVAKVLSPLSASMPRRSPRFARGKR